MTSERPLLDLSEADFDACFGEQPSPPTPLEDLRKARGRHRRRVRTGVLAALAAVVVVAAAGWALSATRLDAAPAGPPDIQVGRDPSGLKIITDDYYDSRTIPAVPPELDVALAFAQALADGNRGDFGFPRIEGNQVVLPAASDRAAPIAEASTPEQRVSALVAYDGAVRADFPRKTNPPDLLSKRLKLTADKLEQFRAHVVVVAGGPSVQSSYDLNDRVFAVAVAQGPPGLVVGSGYDKMLGLVVLELLKPSPAVASAVVDEFGTDTVALHIDPNGGGSAQDGPR